MATLRGSSSSYSVGNIPPEVVWTIVRGDTAAFRVYVTDDEKNPLNIPDWSIKMDVVRNKLVVFPLFPTVESTDEVGEFTVSISDTESSQLETGDLFDIQMSNSQTNQVWTVAQGRVIVIEDITK